MVGMLFFGSMSSDGQPIMDFIKVIENQDIVNNLNNGDRIRIDSTDYEVISTNKLVLKRLERPFYSFEIELIDLSKKSEISILLEKLDGNPIYRQITLTISSKVDKHYTPTELKRLSRSLLPVGTNLKQKKL